jgi:predicted transcriptional regulator
MQQQRIPGDRRGTGLSDDEIDNTVVSFVLDGDSWPWSIEEIARELGDRADAEDAVARLAGAGLVHRIEDFAFPTRSLRRASELRIDAV